MICFPNCKINIGLNVLEKRPDGFHNIESIFYPLPFKDILECVENTQTENAVVYSDSGIQVDCLPEKNLCVKAYNLLREAHQIPDIKIHLHKIIPFRSGLGGGSADAAFTLRMLNDMFFLNLSSKELIHYAEMIGSDCAFFIDNIPAFACGKGEILEPVVLDLSAYTIALILPGISVSTPAAYKKITPRKPDTSLKDLIKKPVSQWKHCISNDFESVVFPEHPAIQKIKETLYAEGALYASMSGSGSSVYGIFNKEIDASALFPMYKTWVYHS